VSRFNPLLWHNRPAMMSYGVAVLSVAAALIIALWPALHLHDAPVSLFLCAIMLSAWFGGVWPGLFTAVLSVLAFYYYFLPPTYS
jgi:K+-sensing histidine kinase KdpD